MIALLLYILFLSAPESLHGCLQATDHYQHTICVTNSSGSSECCGNVTHVCLSFECIMSTITDSTAVLFETMDITLDSCARFSDLYNIAFIGLSSQEIRITCNTSKSDSGAGLGFVRVSNLTLVGLKFEQCGAFHKSATLDTQKINNSLVIYKSSIYIFNSTNIIIDRVFVKRSIGSGIAIFDTNGTVGVRYSSFEWNSVPESERSIYPGGGGVHVEFTYCSPSECYNPSSPGECHNPNSCNKNSSYHFLECTFHKNYATSLNLNVTNYVLGVGVIFQDLGRGGGISIFFKGQAKNNTLNIQNCMFYNNTAVWGGGLSVNFQGAAQENAVFVNDSVFEGNICYTNAGGGADVGYSFVNQSSIAKRNRIHFSNCTFRNNRARFGGGVAIYSTKHDVDLQNAIWFTDCTWVENMATFGSAVDVNPLAMWGPQGMLPSPLFENCHFVSNLVIPEATECSYSHDCVQTKESEGSFTAVGFKIRFRGTLQFENHNGSALHIVSCILEFDPGTRVIFTGNSGFTGGALNLLGLSLIYVNDNSTFTFINNTALERGGAVNVQFTNKHDIILSQGCFIKYRGIKSFDERNVTFMFSGNRAGDSSRAKHKGNSIFLTSLQLCMYECIQNTRIPFHCIGEFVYDYSNDSEPMEYEIATEGGNFTLNGMDLLPLKVIPGKEFLLPFTAMDDLHQKTGELYSVAFENFGESRVRVDGAYSHISDDRLKLSGKPGDEGMVVLSQLSFRRTAISFRVHMQECPPGFVLNTINMHCICPIDSNQTYTGIFKCHSTIFKAYIHRGYWVGYADSNMRMGLLTGYCPSGFCFYYGKAIGSIDYLLTNTSSMEELDTLVCGPMRTGKLCGECRENHSAYYHSESFRCGRNDYCRMGLLFYAISELLPLTVLFIVVMVFNISFTSGTMNAFIFFAQVIDSIHVTAKRIIWFPKIVFELRRVYSLIYRLFNLDMFSINPLAFCLWNGAKSIDVIAFKYVTVAYALILVLFTIMLLNICNCYRFCRCLKPRTVKSSVIHGLSAFLVMCYAQSTRISFLILNPSYLCSIGPTCNHRVMQYHGNTVYFSRAHLLYAIPAIFCLIVITAFPIILLLVYPGHYRILALLKLNENKKLQRISRLIPLVKLKPLFDSFQSCYKDKFRFFAGLYFVYRLLILLTSSFARNWIQFYTITEIQFIIMLTIHALTQPYEKPWHNAVDILIFTDLAIINGLSFFNFVHLRIGIDFQDIVDITSSIQLVLINLPIVYVIVYIMSCLFSRIKSYKNMEEHEDNEIPARLIYGDEGSDSDEDYHDLEEFELQGLHN